jgi:DNA polymerase-3 subunit gamma/tau
VPAGAGALRPATGRASVPPWEDEPPPVDEWSRGDFDADRGARRTPPPAAASDVSDASRATGTAAGAPPRPAAAARVEGTPAAPEPVRTPLGDRWAALVAQLVEAGAVTALVRELALQSECVAFDEAERRIVLRVERESLRHPGHAERLQGALAGTLGRPVQLEVEAGAVQDTPARRDAADRARRQREAEARFGQDPLVQQLTAQFSTARVVPGSIKPL